MAKKKALIEQPTETGEQRVLIDVTPEVAKPIMTLGRKYKAVQKQRLAALALEVEMKKDLSALVKKTNPTTMADGKIKFEYQGFQVIITPTDEKITVKEKKQPE